ncbi:hypothetical protein KY348_07565 [Candidatus Woesearchaeota archaeon]|nr:hypothetical protein [Candidatus Woesearchaeota archaeon]
MTNKKEYWNSLLTEKSWNLLHDIKRKYNFILIGGWAVYLLTHQQKSKDIDIVIGMKELEKLKQKNITKNDRLKKYELKIEEIDIDIYVEYYSQLAMPVEDIKQHVIKIQGYKIASPEILLILKQGAYNDRKNSVKGEKDKIDIISIIFFTDFDFGKYNELLKKYKLEAWQHEIKRIISSFKDYNALNMTPRELKKEKEQVLSKLK